MPKGRRLTVSAIQDGTVIDHITAGQALAIVGFLRLDQHHKPVSIGLRLPSRRYGFKDLIKVEGREITPEEANQIAIMAPEATISIIQDFRVMQKFQVTLPPTLEEVVACPNPRCVTNHQTVTTRFVVSHTRHDCQLMCSYCRNWFNRSTLFAEAKG